MERHILRQRLIDRIDAEVEDRGLTADGLYTRYLDAGSGSPLILLHGASAGAGIGWFPVIGPLARAFRVIVPDCPGHGESAKPLAWYDETFFLDWLAGFLDALELPAATLVGLSQGGAIAVKFALHAPQRVERLVLVDSAGLTPDLPLGFLFAILWGNLLPSEAATRYMMQYIISSEETMIDGIQELVAYGGLVANAPGGRRVLWLGRGKITTALPPSRLSTLTTPTLLLWGQHDRIFPLSVAQDAQQNIPNASLQVVPGTGHVPFFEKREAFLGMLAPFLLQHAGA